ncbi:MAG: hypothetical protein KGJ96_02395 [Xanthomonadaceae bacterium]|jgi:F1F0 ATPase subunit 2|nr:hypothetical protein [Xanthomonadaceae bacterium]MDE2247405.1 hypothetical protein [Xanthomonadaceae bacterium]
MHELIAWALAALAGIALGLFFFGGLWWTVRRGLVARQPALWFLGSLLLRMGVLMGGLLLVGGGDWRRLLACLLGLVVGRAGVTRLVRVATVDETSKEQADAP